MKFNVKYATRNAKGKETHRQFKVVARDESIARVKAEDKLRQRKSYNRYSDYIYSVTECTE